MKLNYANFLLESKLHDLLLETKIVFKNDLIKTLRKVDHQIAIDLLSIIDQDVDVTMNIFDVGENPDSIKFYNTNQIKDDEKYQIIDYGRTYDTFTSLFKLAGVENTTTLSNGTIGKVVNIWDGNNAGHLGTFAVWPSDLKIAQFLSDSGHTAFIQMSGIRKIDGELKGLPQETRIGRVATKLLQKVNKKYSPKEVEEFVNKFKSTVEILRDKLKSFKIVSGDDIAYWYSEMRYVSGNGTLQNSCMRYSSCEDYFSVYTENKDKVSLLILKSEDNEDKITGRALIWKLDSGETFMDRIYYTKEEEVELFKEYARKNGWIFKVRQNMDFWGDVEFTDGKQNSMIIKVTLNTNFDKFPYMDTMRFLYKNKGIISNQERLDNDYNDHRLDRTEGWLSGCDTCDGEESITCGECDGDGKVSCRRCRGNCTVKCRECDGEGDSECGECDGSGEVEGSDGENVPCSYCSNQLHSGRISCDECDGSGEVDCSLCDGEGELDCDSCGGAGNMSCPECQ